MNSRTLRRISSTACICSSVAFIVSAAARSDCTTAARAASAATRASSLAARDLRGFAQQLTVLTDRLKGFTMPIAHLARFLRELTEAVCLDPATLPPTWLHSQAYQISSDVARLDAPSVPLVAKARGSPCPQDVGG
jgi:hypothetical protein